MAAGCFAQSSPSPAGRSFPYPAANVQAALQKLGAYQGARLPSLEGFVSSTRNSISGYERPYYEYKIDLEPRGSNETMVGVKAHVSAWYADPRGITSGYQDFESNGRLESDLLGRLSDFLKTNGAMAGADAQSLQRQIDDVRRQRQQTEDYIGQLEKQMQDARDPQTAAGDPQYAAVIKPRASLFSAPGAGAVALLHAREEDVFEILDRTGSWLHVQLDDNRSAWMSASNARLFTWVEGPPQANIEPALAPGFTIVRELTSSFSGEWPRLKGKQAVYIWARPEGSSLDVQSDKKLPFAESIFMQRYRQEIHHSGEHISGIVVIFLDVKGGVVAATLEDIGAFADGSLTSQTFLRKCSLDPPSAFARVSPTPHATLSSRTGALAGR
jgi:hypothetical protein